ncbi:unnamed protein product [Ilex paraguariensis]|uniref:Nudix hydrolase domain-containing protein n=1 Tax=Ilex paraguariensis TaxID=185542 RepID=A0ABC8USB7_9AQUA
METLPEGYRRNVGICLINPSKKIFAASRLDIPDAWQMPQGGIDENEDPRNAAIRELREETGVTSAEILVEGTESLCWFLFFLEWGVSNLHFEDAIGFMQRVPYWLTYDFPPEVREKLNHQWGSDWKGKDEEIDLLGDGTEKPEFGEWKWMSPEQVVDLAVDFKRPVYKEVLTVLSPHLE